MIFCQKKSQMNINPLLTNYNQKVSLMANGLKMQLESLQHALKRGLETIVPFFVLII